ncbi:sodium-coupled monocarboxylate transporter 1-like [Glandiceps talaboti]
MSTPAPGEIPSFSIADFIVFGCTLTISISIGVYHAVAGGKQRSSGEFLLANRNMNAIPVAMSLTASFMSAITILGTPADFYVNGSMFGYFGLAYTEVMILSAEVYMPIFYKLKATSAYETELVYGTEEKNNAGRGT